MRNQKGWTVVELIMGVALVGVLCLGGLALYALAHFVMKFW